MALALWVKYGLEGGGPMDFTAAAIVYLVLAAGAMGFGYAAWNVGILHGNVTILAGASYFIPVLSSALSVWLLGASLSWAFGRARPFLSAPGQFCAGWPRGASAWRRFIPCSFCW